jgi:hypothetical protein
VPIRQYSKIGLFIIKGRRSKITVYEWRFSQVSELLQEAVHDKRKILIDQLIQSGVYKIKNKHLYEMTLSELEKEYVTIGLANELSQHTYR